MSQHTKFPSDSLSTQTITGLLRAFLYEERRSAEHFIKNPDARARKLRRIDDHIVIVDTLETRLLGYEEKELSGN